MKDIILFYLIANSFYLGYIRLRDTGKLMVFGTIGSVLFSMYIGFLALPLTAIYWLKNKIFK